MRKIILEIPEVAYANMLNLDGSVIGAYEGSDYRIYLKDMQGSTSSIVNQDMSIAAAYTYDDFGQTTELAGSTIENEICYTGALYDKVTGLYYLNARYYDPEYARFISQDTYRGEPSDSGQWHLYAYCANNPINYYDPSGHDAIVLKSNFLAPFVGHMAVLIQTDNNWKYFSWADKGWKSPYMGKMQILKTINLSLKKTLQKI